MPSPCTTPMCLAADFSAGAGYENPQSPWGMQSIILTSGTTGPSKGVMSSYVHLYSMAISAPFLGREDRYMINLPMFHSGGVMPVTAMLIHGGSIAMVDAFDTDTFWSTVRERRITTSILLGVMGEASFSSVRSRPTTRTTRCEPAPTCRSTTPRRSSMRASAPTSTPTST